MAPRDRARLRIESSEDRVAPAVGAFVRPAPGAVLPDAEDGARPATDCVASYLGPATSPDDFLVDAAEVTITNRTWHRIKFTLSSGTYLGSYRLGPAESVSLYGLGVVRLTYQDGRGWSTRSLKAGQSYQFVERGGVFLLERD